MLYWDAVYVHNGKYTPNFGQKNPHAGWPIMVEKVVSSAKSTPRGTFKRIWAAMPYMT